MAEISLPEWVQTQMARLDQEIEKSLSLENGELRALSIDGRLCAWAVVSDIFQNTATPDYVLAVTVTLFEGKVKRKTRPLAKERAISKIDVGLWYCENDIAVDSWVTMALGAIWTSINTTVKEIPWRYSRQQAISSYGGALDGRQPTVVTDSPARPISQYQDFGTSQAARNVFEPQYYEASAPFSANERELANRKAIAMQADMNQQMQAAMDQMGRDLLIGAAGLGSLSSPRIMPKPEPVPKTIVVVIGSSRRRIILEDE
jgi:hypothetical protein